MCDAHMCIIRDEREILCNRIVGAGGYIVGKAKYSQCTNDYYLSEKYSGQILGNIVEM